jgi:FlaA1/EpsC-like NDP-sugar epimerase
VLTNVNGTRNVIDASLARGVGRALALSTDKAVNPINLYGATKLVAEKLVVQANAYRGAGPTRFSCVRYGNVVGSRGSVVPLVLQQRKTGRVTVTDPRMSRFWITLEQGVRFVIACIERMQGGEVFVPKLPTTTVGALAEALAPGCAVDVIGIRPGEKLHEVLLAEDEARSAFELQNMFVVQPTHPWWNSPPPTGARPLPEGFRYSSDDAKGHLSIGELRSLLSALPEAGGALS